MATTEVTSKDRERYARARALGEARAQDPSAVVGARYDPEKDLIELEFAGGSSMTILRKIVPGLERASTSKLESIVVSPTGDALSWPSLDVDVYVPGLVERAFGTRLFAAATGRRGAAGDQRQRRQPQRPTGPRAAVRANGYRHKALESPMR